MPGPVLDQFPTRGDFLKLRKIVGEMGFTTFSTGGYKALKEAMQKGAVLPAVGLALLAPSLLSEEQSDN